MLLPSSPKCPMPMPYHPTREQTIHQAIKRDQMPLKPRRSVPTLPGMSPLHTRLPLSSHPAIEHALSLRAPRRSVLNQIIVDRIPTKIVPVVCSPLKLLRFSPGASDLPCAYSFPLLSQAATTCW